MLETVVVVCTMIFFPSWPEAMPKIKKMVKKTAIFWQMSQYNSYTKSTLAKVSYEYTAPRSVQFISYRRLFNDTTCSRHSIYCPMRRNDTKVDAR
jgi:hypothetical protein